MKSRQNYRGVENGEEVLEDVIAAMLGTVVGEVLMVVQ